MKVVAVFDFDGTLSPRDNVLPFIRAAAGTIRLLRGLVAAAPRLTIALVSDRGREPAKAALVRHTLKGYDADELAARGERFAELVVQRHLRPEVVERVEWHRRHGHELVLASASFSVYLEPVGRHLGFAAVLATELEIGKDGGLTGNLAGHNVRRREKVRRLDAWLGDRPAYVWAYGDSRGDHELFERADRPIWVGRRRRGRRFLRRS
jgi:phosphatidylglycerophosphatase C